MPITITQAVEIAEQTINNGATLSVTLASAPAAGELLRFALHTNNATVDWFPLSDFVMDGEVGGTIFTNLRIYSKIATGNEGTTFALLRNDVGLGRKVRGRFERCSAADPDTPLAAPAASVQGNSTQVLSRSSGTLATVTDAAQAFAAWAINEADAASGNTFTGFTNSFVAGRTNGVLGTATKNLAAGATATECTATWNDNGKAHGLIVAYREPVVSTDVTPPTVTINAIHGTGHADNTYTAAGYNAANDALTVTGTAADDVTVDHVTVEADDLPLTTAQGTTSWTAVLGVSGWAAGAHVVKAIAYDAAGNPSTPATFTVWHSPDGSWVWAGAGQHLVPVSVLGH